MKLDRAPKRPAASQAGIVARLLKFRAEEGSELMEFALVFPALMCVLTLVVSGAFAFYSFQQLGTATANAAQYVANDAGLSTNPCLTAASQVTGAWQLTGWNASSFSYTLSITQAVGTSSASTATSSGTGSAFTCSSMASDLSGTPPVAVVLKVSYPYNWLPVFSAHNYSGHWAPTTGNITVTQGAVAN
jgi:Flp pilus assembly protein TadG